METLVYIKQEKCSICLTGYNECEECGRMFEYEYGCETTCSTKCWEKKQWGHFFEYDGWRERNRTDVEYYNRYKALWDQLESEKPIEEKLGTLMCGNWIDQINQINRIAERLNLIRWEPDGDKFV